MLVRRKISGYFSDKLSGSNFTLLSLQGNLPIFNFEHNFRIRQNYVILHHEVSFTSRGMASDFTLVKTIMPVRPIGDPKFILIFCSICHVNKLFTV